MSNAAYRDSPLLAAPTDAAQMMDALGKSGFKVTLSSDIATQRDLVEKTLVPFLNQVRVGDVVVIYYFGHGFAHGNDSFLVPTQAPTDVAESEIYDTFLPERAIRELASERRPSIVFIFLDACRVVTQFKNPGQPSPLIPQALKDTIDGTDMVVSYASDYGSPAFSRSKDSASFYTEALARELWRAPVDFSEVQRSVITKVELESKYKQKAWFLSDLQSFFFFIDTPSIQEKERQLWKAALHQGNRYAIEMFLHQNRTSGYADDARRWLKNHPDARATENLALSRVSPISAELKWRATDDEVFLPQLRSDLAVSRTITLAKGESVKDFETSTSDELLAASRSATVTRSIVVRAEPDGKTSIRLPLGQRIELSIPSNGKVTATTKIDNEQNQISLPVSDLNPGSIPVGRPLAEFNLEPDATLPAIVDLQKLEKEMNFISAQTTSIGWVSISVPSSIDERQQRLRLLQTTFVQYQLTKYGIPDARITVVQNDEKDRESLRVRIYGFMDK